MKCFIHSMQLFLCSFLELATSLWQPPGEWRHWHLAIWHAVGIKIISVVLLWLAIYD